MIDGDKTPDPGAEPGASTRWNYCCSCDTHYHNPEEAVDCCQAIEATNSEES